MTTPKVIVRYRQDFHGWAMECPRCGALSVRETWKTAYWTARSHWAAHARFSHEH